MEYHALAVIAIFVAAFSITATTREEEASWQARLSGVDADLCAVQRGAQGLFQGLNGGAVRPGSILPPTADQLARRDRLAERLESALRSLN